MSDLKGIFDSHCHYNDSAFDSDRDSLLDGLMSPESPVCGLLHAATDVSSMRFGIEMAAKYPNFYTSVGFHPEMCASLPPEPEAVLRENLSASDKIVAVGEVGLDYHFEGYDKELQLRLLRMQIELAMEKELPLIFHCRDATADFLSLMHEYKPRGVVHCFSGSPEVAEELLSLGLYLGFGGVLTYKNSKKVKRSFALVPEDRFLFETDCPYLAPEPYRGQRCDSTMIAEAALCGAEIKGSEAQELIDRAAENTRILFKLRGQQK